MGSIIENHTDRKEIINLLCILFILGSSFLSYIIPSLTSQMFSIGLTLFGYICFIFTNWTSLKRFYLYHKSIKYFVLYVLSNLIISTFFVQGWDNWGLYFTHTSILFLPIWSYLVQSKQKGKYFSIILITILLLSLFKYPYKGDQTMTNFGGSTAILYLYILFFFKLKNTMKILIALFFIMSFGFDLTDRTHLIMMSSVAILSLLTIFRWKFITENLNKIRHILLYLPIVLFITAGTGFFNIFNLTNTSNFEQAFSHGQTTDTRTELYKEIIYDQTDLFNIIFGKSFAGTYNSNLKDAYELIKFHRNGVEVGILEFYLWGGLFFIILFFCLIRNASAYAMHNSHNHIMKIISIFVVLYWCVMSIELQMSQNSWSIAFWLSIGLCYNKRLLNMTDKRISLFIKKRVNYETIFKKATTKI